MANAPNFCMLWKMGVLFSFLQFNSNWTRSSESAHKLKPLVVDVAAVAVAVVVGAAEVLTQPLL